MKKFILLLFVYLIFSFSLMQSTSTILNDFSFRRVEDLTNPSEIVGNISFFLNQTLRYGEQDIQNNDRLCKGSLLVSLPLSGNFSILYRYGSEVPKETRVPRLPCPTAECFVSEVLDPNKFARPNLNILFVESSEFENYRNYIKENGADTGLTPSIATVMYYTADFVTVKWANASLGVYCYGTKKIYNAQNALATFSLTQDSSTLPLLPGNYEVRSDANILECAAMGRTKDSSKTLDISLHNSTPFLLSTTAISFSVYNGPNLSVSNIVFSSPVIAGQQATVTFNITNNGDVDANVTNITLYNSTLGNIVITNPNPSFPFVVPAGQSKTFTGNFTAPSSTGTYGMRVNISYKATMNLIGNCDELRSELSGFQTLTVVYCPSLTANLTLSGSQFGIGDTVYFNITINNTGGEANITSITVNGLSSVTFLSSFPVTVGTGQVVTIKGSGIASPSGTRNVNATVYYTSFPGCPTPPVSTNNVQITVNCPSVTATLTLDSNNVGIGDTVNFNITITNTLANANITSITVTGLSNINLNPSPPITMSKGQTITIKGNGTASTLTNSINVTINYTSLYPGCPMSTINLGTPITVNCPSVTATLTLDKTEYGVGEIAYFNVTIINSLANSRITDIDVIGLDPYSLDTSFPFNILKGQRITVKGNGSVGGPGDKDVNVTIFYDASPYQGCEGQVSVIRRITVYDDIIYSFNVTPFSILKINGDYYRGNDKVNNLSINGKLERYPKIGNVQFNITVEKWNSAIKKFDIVNFKKPVEDKQLPARYCYPFLTCSRDFESIRIIGSTLIFDQTQPISSPLISFPSPGFEVGVYKVTLDVYDGTLNKNMDPIFKYFVIYSQSCVDRA